MERDDVVYLTLLIFTIILGYFTRKIPDRNAKKWMSTVTGFILVLLVSGTHIIHPVICILANSVIILCLNKRHCHVVSFSFTFLYLIFFRTSAYFGIPYAPNHTNMIQMVLTLKIIGLAFEVHDSHVVEEKTKEISEMPKCKIDPNFFDIVHYCFCYIGVLTGPYYTYATFDDYNKKNFHKHAPCSATTFAKLKCIPIFAIVFLLSSKYFPIKYVDSDEFYASASFWYRLFYITPVFVTFRMRIYIGLILSECACTMAGLGAYPSYTEPRPGKGPTTRIKEMKEEEDDDSLKKLTYSFEAVNNIDTWYTEVDPLVRSSIRYWNMCVQYWMAFIVYKRFPSKKLRTPATFAVSAIWHGIYAGYYLCLGVVPFYLTIEDLWEGLLRKGAVGNRKRIADALFWVVRTQAFSYMGMAFSLLTMERGLRYYGSVYYVYHVTSIAALVSGLIIKNFLLKGRRKAEPSAEIKGE